MSANRPLRGVPGNAAPGRLPVLSLALCLLACLLMLLPPPAREVLYFDWWHLCGGRFWGLVTGHWLHADLEHLAWNTAALLVLAAMIEARSRRLLAWSIVIGTLSVDVLLLSPLGGLQRYCGLSGLLNTLMGVALYLQWCESRSRIVLLIAIASILKIALELHSGHSVFTSISWPPFAQAHLAGMAGALLVIGCLQAARPAPSHLLQGSKQHYGYLGTGRGDSSGHTG